MPTMQHLPAWTVSYRYEIQPSIERTRQSGGAKRQSKLSHRRIMVASATRRLLGAELPYFEWFIRNECQDGSLKFNDIYADQNGQQTGTVRIMGGRYSVSTDKRVHTVECELEVFR